MRPTALAAALLAAPLAAAQERAGLRGPALSASGPDETALLAACQAFDAPGSCGAGGGCTWCEAGAVPSACYPSSMTGRLPAGVFRCASGQELSLAEGAATPAVPEGGGERKEEKKKARRAQAFSLKEGVTHTLDSAQVDGDFCDASSPVSYAGYMNVKGSQFDTNDDKNLFYWFFEKRATSQLPAPAGGGIGLESAWWPFSKKEEKPAEAAGGDEKGAGAARKEAAAAPAAPVPLVIWLTGGPGCSSSLALLSENGPCSVNPDGATTKVNPHSWTESAHVLWLDQPADVGYSYGQGNDSNEEMISEDAYYFLQAFFKSDQGRKYKDAPLHIVGESYGGHYAPAIAHRILRGNEDLKDGLARLNLRGLAVGNGLTDPEEQYKHYADMAYKNSHNIKVVDEETYNMMAKMTPACTAGIGACNGGEGMLNSFACQAAFVGCNTVLTTPYRLTGKSPYDITKDCGLNPLCADFSHMEKFMNQDSTKRALHVEEHNPTWKTCNMGINMSFHVDWMKNFAPYVADLLNAGVPALIYAGDLDFVCNYIGNRAWTLKLDWDHKDEFNAAEEHDWNGGAGLARTARGLTFLQVYDAGHMVPTDQPEHALRMITQHLNGQTF